MAIQNFFTSRDNKLDGNTYVGQLGRLWYNPDTNSIYASDGATVGGVPVDLATGANAAFDGITVNTISSDDSTEVKFITNVTFDDEVSVNGNLVVFGNISAAAPNKIGGIQPGPGVDISNTGLLTIDSANLSFSFGNFTANNNILTIVNNNENMILETQGNAEIQLVGNVGFYRTNGGGVPDPANRTFRALDDGQITIFVSNTDPLLGAVEIIGSTAGQSIAPGITGSMLHITGQTDEDCRMYYDGIGGYVSFVGRRFNGSVASPTQVLSGQDVIRINATAATDAGVGNVAMAQISVTALENQTTTAQGSSITFTTTPVGQPATNRVDVATISVANGVSATQFNTGNTVSATGNVVGGNINTAGLVSATGNVVGGNIRTAGSVLSSGTGGVGYVTGAGGTVTQLTSKTTAVTLNKISGEITSNNDSISGDAVVSFRFNNSTISNTDVMIINQTSVANIGLYTFMANCQNGYANIHIHNDTNTAKADVIVMRYAVIKGAIT